MALDLSRGYSNEAKRRASPTCHAGIEGAQHLKTENMMEARQRGQKRNPPKLPGLQRSMFASVSMCSNPYDLRTHGGGAARRQCYLQSFRLQKGSLELVQLLRLYHQHESGQ